MTAQELIAVLQKLPPDATILTRNNEYGYPQESIGVIKINKKDPMISCHNPYMLL